VQHTNITPATLEESRDAKQRLQDETRNKLEEIREKKQNLVLERAQLAIDLTITLEKNMQMVEELMEMEIQLAEAESELEHLNSNSQRVRDMLEERQLEVDRLKRHIQERTESARKLSKRIQDNTAALRENEHGEEIELMRDRWLGGLNLDDGEELDEEAARTIEDLDAEVIATKGRLELLHEGNPRALQQFEQRAIQIAQTKDKIANFEANLAAISTAIDEIRRHWEPELEALVEKISEAFAHNFERIGCAGQVSVRKDENDFREWAIQIEVKFRYAIPLHSTRHR
jgi:chromosome segregation ATPase